MTAWLLRHRWKVLGSVVIALSFVWLLRAGALPLVPSREAAAAVKPWAIPAYVLIWLLVHALRGGRWYWLLAPVHRVPLPRVLAVAAIGFAAILLLPFRTGEVVRPLLIRKRGHLSAWEATGSVGAERVIDGLVLSALLFAALRLSTPLDPLPDRIGTLPVPASVVPGAAYAALFGFLCVFAAMALFYWRRTWARALVSFFVAPISKRLAEWLSGRVEEVSRGLSFLPQARYTLPFLLTTLAYWLLNAFGVWVLAVGCGFEDMHFAQALAIVGVLALGILVPNAPGFFGAFQISVYAGLAMYFPADRIMSAGAAFVFFLYVVQLSVTFALGALAMALERVSAREALTVE